MSDFICILGAPNDDLGALSQLALGRVELAVSLYRRALEIGVPRRIVATGGFGAHFNRSPRPHFELVHEELVRRGVAADAIVRGAFFSANTVEDALVLEEVFAEQAVSAADVVTTHFHEPRCRLVFACVCRSRQITIRAAPNPDDLAISAIAHEEDAIARIKARGGVTSGFGFLPLPTMFD